MYAKGLTPDQITYNTIIKCFCKAQDFEKAFQLHNEMLMHNLEPTPVTYNLLINGLCVYGDLEDADRLLVSLDDGNINLTKFAYTTLIKAHCAKGDVYRAVGLFLQMVGKGFEISIRDYSAYFFCMMLSDGISSDQELCEVMLNVFDQGGDFDSAAELLAKMIKFGFHPD
ncbi:pentatricopeptide repeat-containing protein [Pyrus ussuriensis x Pyrus communis]|uniref:Pentatricopeptide repeat-containing protein n=1 Tax=Pyrus ussuriensis x Pyrus communis TaxID=2448454 RepID=A0A5N5GFH3_9ROSA|nr:pentatricopeptide repeat-containing protein [Pyrus ussuriensis x Pyrus communis]